MRDEFKDIISGWTLVSGFQAITERLEEVARWSEQNKPLLSDEEATVKFMIQTQIAIAQEEGIGE